MGTVLSANVQTEVGDVADLGHLPNIGSLAWSPTEVVHVVWFLRQLYTSCLSIVW